MKRIIYNLLVFMLLGMAMISCSDFLDREPTDYSTKGFFKSEEAIRDGTLGIYNSIYNVESLFLPNYPFTVERLDVCTGLSLERGENETIGAGAGLNPDNDWVSGFWNRLYALVARANSVIDGSKEDIDDLGDKAQQYVAEARVLRAWAYYHLIVAYGDVPFFTVPVTIEQYKDERTDRALILDFILNELDQAADKLSWTATDRGRVDKSFAYGLKARAALLGGSLNFGGRGMEYFRTAATAADLVIGKRGLATNFDDLFNITGQAKSDVRNELIFEIMYSAQGTKKTHGLAFSAISRNTGQTGCHPAMLLADTYECIDGKRIDESPLYDPKHPQRNRDPRFHSTLWMHGDTVSVNSGSIVTQVLEAYEGECAFYNYSTGQWEMRVNADINSGAAWTSFCNAGSGYIWGKFSNEIAENITNANSSCNTPVMRYAEVLLIYAEAKIELNELDNSVYEAINAVRNRSHMPDVSDDRKGDQWKMRQLVRRERKVELIREGLHFADVRRWGIGDLENGQPSYGNPIPEIRYEGLSATDIPNFNKTERHDLNDIANYDAYKEKLRVRDINRFWDKKFELWPIPQIERDRNPNLVQNEGY